MDRKTVERIKKRIDAYTKEHTKTPEAARDALVREGIYLEDGQLAPYYRCDPNPMS